VTALSGLRAGEGGQEFRKTGRSERWNRFAVYRPAWMRQGRTVGPEGLAEETAIAAPGSIEKSLHSGRCREVQGENIRQTPAVSAHAAAQPAS